MKYDSSGNFEQLSDKETVSLVRKWILWGIIILVVVGSVFTFVAWDVGWWFSNQNVNRQALQLQHSYGAQSAYVEKARENISEFNAIQSQIDDPTTPKTETSDLLAQQQAIVNQTCGIIGNISFTTPKDVAAWSRTYCSN